MLYHISNSNASIQKLSKLASWFLHLLTGFASLLSLETERGGACGYAQPKDVTQKQIDLFQHSRKRLRCHSHHHTHKLLLWYLLTRIVFNRRIVWPNQLWQRPVLKSLPELTAMKAGSHTVTGSRSNQFKTNTHTHKPVGQNRTL